jgi:hypothetical protein
MRAGILLTTVAAPHYRGAIRAKIHRNVDQSLTTKTGLPQGGAPRHTSALGCTSNQYKGYLGDGGPRQGSSNTSELLAQNDVSDALGFWI